MVLRSLRHAVSRIDLKLCPPTACIGLSPDVVAANTKRSSGRLACSMRLAVLPERGTTPNLQQRIVVDIAE